MVKTPLELCLAILMFALITTICVNIFYIQCHTSYRFDPSFQLSAQWLVYITAYKWLFAKYFSHIIWL